MKDVDSAVRASGCKAHLCCLLEAHISGGKVLNLGPIFSSEMRIITKLPLRAVVRIWCYTICNIFRRLNGS